MYLVFILLTKIYGDKGGVFKLHLRKLATLLISRPMRLTAITVVAMATMERVRAVLTPTVMPVACLSINPIYPYTYIFLTI